MGTEEDTLPTDGPLGSGMGTVVAAGALAVLCTFGLLIGGHGVVTKAFASTAPSAGTHASPSPGENGGPTAADGTGTSTVEPTSPPERGSAPEPVQATDTVYLIRWGDTLSQISLDTGVGVARLAEYNSIPNADLIYAEAPLTIPYILIPGQDAAAAPVK